MGLWQVMMYAVAITDDFSLCSTTIFVARSMGKALVINCVLMKGDILRCLREGRMEIDGGNDCRGGDGGRK